MADPISREEVKTADDKRAVAPPRLLGVATHTHTPELRQPQIGP